MRAARPPVILPVRVAALLLTAALAAVVGLALRESFGHRGWTIAVCFCAGALIGSGMHSLVVILEEWSSR